MATSTILPGMDVVAPQLVRYLEQRGIRHVYGLCGHTNIAVLSAMAGSELRFILSLIHI